MNNTSIPRFIQSFSSNGCRWLLGMVVAITTASLAAAQTPQASYPLLTTLGDTTNAYGPVTLTGGATGPAQGVCVNGVYAGAGGQDARTPDISTLDSNDFQLELEFQVAALAGSNRPILIGGNGWRWIGFQVQSDGTFGILHNNAISEWSTSLITVGTWHTSVIKYELGEVELWLDGTMVLQSTIGVLDTGNDLCFTTNNWSNGTNHNGCIRNLVISNDTTLGGVSTPLGTNYCTANPNATGAIGVMSALGSPIAANNDVTLMAESLPSNQFGIFLVGQMSAFIPNAGGTSNGNICIGGGVGRYNQSGQILSTGATGSISLPINLATIPQGNGTSATMSGDTWFFQAWHRSGIGLGSNFTDGLEINFQ